LSAGGSEIPAERLTEVASEIQRMRTRVATLRVRSTPRGTMLYVDGISRGTAEGAFLLNAGTRTVRAERAGYETVELKFDLAGGDQQEITFELVPRKSNPLPSDLLANRVEPSAGEPRGYGPFVVSAATTLALGGAAGVFGWLAVRANDRLESELNRFPLDVDARRAASKDTKTYALISDCLSAGAFVGLVASVYFLATAGSLESPASPEAASSLPRIGFGGQQITLSGSF
jgi:hypothetical protein